jgi:hypothetical protein
MADQAGVGRPSRLAQKWHGLVLVLPALPPSWVSDLEIALL